MSKKPTPEPDATFQLPDVLPVLPLKDAVLFPYVIVPLSVGRDKSVVAVDQALAGDRLILLLAQKRSDNEDPAPEDLHMVGTAALIMRMLKLPDGRIRILVQGLARVRAEHISQTEPFLQAKVQRLDATPMVADSLETQALVRSVKEAMDKAITLGRTISPEVMVIAANLDDPGRLADLAASNIELKVQAAQSLLEELDVATRLRKVSDLLLREVQVLTMQQEISSQARGEMDRSQREYFLRQQLKAIQQELGEGEELAEELAAYTKLIEERQVPAEPRAEIEKQMRRLERSHPDSAETAILRTYLDWLTGLPWATVSQDHLDLVDARRVLDEDHFDLEKVKDRILESLAVRKLKPDTRGPILCFVGPPGVGKTSLGRSIARAMGRKFVRVSLGGVRDEAEIRGHRRTYVGALPGRIIQGIHQAATSNPVFMLDEIDKLGADYRGDPSSALLEVLDPEQNWSFRDHYLGVAYDLSKVMFITTANLLDPIQPAFLDRMEVIRLSGYTQEEKLHIAQRHLIPKQTLENGLGPERISFTDAGLRRIISGYTREAGLRNFERELAAICRKVAVQVANGKSRRVVVNPARVERLLGPEKHFSEELLQHDRIGVATGLAWTAAGGDLLFIEVIAVPGKGQLMLTGQLGDVMKESAQAALSFARAYAGLHGMPENYFAKHDLHVHVPAGSIPKDGPSAGITIAAAIISVLTGRPIDRSLAMTGEITLRGDVMPIGGLKEKVLAARIAGITRVILPHLNSRDMVEVPPELQKGLEFRFVKHVDEVLELALRPAPARRARPQSQGARARRVRKIAPPPSARRPGSTRVVAGG